MAHLIEVTGPSNDPNERRAHDYLRKNLPSTWIVTTNIPKYLFAGMRGAKELDCLLISQNNLLVLDFKNFGSRTIPHTHGPWLRSDGVEIKNPFKQIDDACMLLKHFFAKQAAIDVWVEGVIVTTGKKNTIDWDHSDVDVNLRRSVIRLDEVEAYVAERLSKRRPLAQDTKRQIFKALKISNVTLTEVIQFPDIQDNRSWSPLFGLARASGIKDPLYFARCGVLCALFDRETKHGAMTERQFMDRVAECADDLNVRDIDLPYTQALGRMAIRKQREIDEVIDRSAFGFFQEHGLRFKEWSLDQLNTIDRIILRLGLADLLYTDRAQVSAKAAINGAMQLSKVFSRSSGRFVEIILRDVHIELGQPP